MSARAPKRRRTIRSAATEAERAGLERAYADCTRCVNLLLPRIDALIDREGPGPVLDALMTLTINLFIENYDGADLTEFVVRLAAADV